MQLFQWMMSLPVSSAESREVHFDGVHLNHSPLFAAFHSVFRIGKEVQRGAVIGDNEDHISVYLPSSSPSFLQMRLSPSPH